MKASSLAAVVSLFAVACNKSGGSAGGPIVSAEDSISYIIGFQLGNQFKAQKAPVRIPALVTGVDEALKGADSKFTPDQSRAIIMAYQQKQMDSISGVANKFLTDNATKEGVKSTPSGLQYKVIREGRGAKPKATSRVTVHYKGMLVNGTPFDSSYGGSPPTMGLNEVIPGWTEGVQLMTPGSKYQFWVPGQLAYGPEGRPPVIGPNETLIFEIELVAVK